MSWIFYALLAPALYTGVTFVDKYLLESKIRNYAAMPIFGAITALVMGSLFWIVTGFPLLNLRDGLIVITTGILSSFVYFIYFKALSIEETSNINIFFQIVPVFTLILSSLFLRQALGERQIIGFLLILGTTIALSLKREKKRFHLSQAFWLILLADIIYAVAGVLMAFAIHANSFSRVLSYESFGIAIGGVLLYLLFPSIRRAFWENRRVWKTKTVRILFANESLNVIAKAVTFFAFSLGPVALVSVLEGTQGFFAIAYGIILTVLFPKVFHEGIKRKEITKKIILAVFLFIGIFLLY